MWLLTALQKWVTFNQPPLPRTPKLSICYKKTTVNALEAIAGIRRNAARFTLSVAFNSSPKVGTFLHPTLTFLSIQLLHNSVRTHHISNLLKKPQNKLTLMHICRNSRQSCKIYVKCGSQQPLKS